METKRMKSVGPKICLADFYFKRKNGSELKVKDVVCKKLPALFLKEDMAYDRAIQEISLTDMKELVKTDAGLVFRVEYTKELDSHSYAEDIYGL